MGHLKRLLPVLLVVGAALVPFTLLAQSDVTGDWEITITSPLGARTTPISLKQEGEKLTGMFKSQAGELPVEGSVVGGDLTLAFTMKFQGQSLPVTMTGIVDVARSVFIAASTSRPGPPGMFRSRKTSAGRSPRSASSAAAASGASSTENPSPSRIIRMASRIVA